MTGPRGFCLGKANLEVESVEQTNQDQTLLQTWSPRSGLPELFGPRSWVWGAHVPDPVYGGSRTSAFGLEMEGQRPIQYWGYGELFAWQADRGARTR